MEEYQSVKPSPLLSAYVKHYWFLKTASPTPTTIRTVPTGHICLIFHRGNRIYSATAKDMQPRAFISGHEHGYHDLIYTSQVDMISVVFRPIGAKAFFNIPISEINGQKIAICDLEDRQLYDLEKALTNTTDNHRCVLLIERFLFQRINKLAEHNIKRINHALKLIETGHKEVTMLADSACLSHKQFNRIFNEYIGAKPKEFLRVIRFQRAIYMLQSQPEISLAQLAAGCGYYDQPHLIKEFKTFSGYTPVEYLDACPPYSDYFSED